MTVYKFGGATTRTKRGIEALVRLSRAAHSKETAKSKRRKAAEGKMTGLVVVISAIGHTTRYLQRAAELSQQGEGVQAEEFLEKIVTQHTSLLQSLALESEEDVLEEFEEIAEDTRSLLEGIGITRELSRRTRDAMLVQGERFALALLAAALREHGLPIKVVNATDVMITDETFGAAQPIAEEIEARAWKLIAPRLKRSDVVLIQGFAGATRDGITTTMGSESSDLTATLLGGALHAGEVVIWKTVPGIFSADPELVPAARLLTSLSFSEAEELGRRGARILHPSIAHPLLAEGNETTLRVADPLSKNSRSTLLQREPKKAPSVKPLSLALEQHLYPLRLREIKRDEASGELLATARRRKEKLREIIQRAPYKWSTAVEETICLRKEEKTRAVQKLSSDYHVAELPAVSVLSLVSRQNGAIHPAPHPGFFRALRSLPLQSLTTNEHSTIAILDDASGIVALRKAHKEIFGK